VPRRSLKLRSEREPRKARRAGVGGTSAWLGEMNCRNDSYGQRTRSNEENSNSRLVSGSVYLNQ
jgi:hypothetical protein